MTLLTDFRNAVKDIVHTATGITINDGKFDGPVRNDDLGCIFPVSVREDSNVSRQIMEIRVRLFLNKQGAAADPELNLLSPAPLEALIEECQTALAPSGVGDTPNVAGLWFARLTEAEINLDQYGIEFAVVGVAWNVFAVV